LPTGKLYSTAIGEITRYTLPDGSTLDLNSNSRVRVYFSGQERFIEVLSGEALFNVHPDARPFLVASGRVLVRDISTKPRVTRFQIKWWGLSRF